MRRSRILVLATFAAVIVGAGVVAFVVRSDDESSDPSATPTAEPNGAACPVDPAICDFAKRVEYEFREGNPKTLISPKSTHYPDSGIIDAGIGSWRDRPFFPRVIGIGCSIETDGRVCIQAFSLVLTASPNGEQTERIDRVLLGFLRHGDGLPIVTANRLVGGGFDLVTSGVDSGDCRLSGIVDSRPCEGTRFFHYTTGPAVARPTPAATPTRGATDPLAGLDAVELAPGMQSSIGYDTVVYYSIGCFGCGRPQIPNLYRAYRTSSGDLRTDDLFGPLLAKSGGYPHSVAADWEHGRLLVLVCAIGYCGGESDPSPDAVLKVFRSHDGGATFAEETTPGLPVGAFLAGFAGDQAIVSVGGRQGLDHTFRHFLYPSNTPLTPPAGIGKAEPIPGRGGTVAWRVYEPPLGLFNSDGSLLIPSGPGRPLARAWPTEYGWLALWAAPSAPDNYLGLIDAFGVRGLLHYSRYLDIRGQLPNGQLYGNIELAAPFGFGVDAGGPECKLNQPVYPALIDWRTGGVFPIHELGTECPGGRHAFVNAILSRSVARVATGGDCLNVRREPTTTAASLGCFADGVLLFIRGDGPPPVVPGWLPVVTPGLEPGWVAEEFVER